MQMAASSGQQYLGYPLSAPGAAYANPYMQQGAPATDEALHGFAEYMAQQDTVRYQTAMPAPHQPSLSSDLIETVCERAGAALPVYATAAKRRVRKIRSGREWFYLLFLYMISFPAPSALSVGREWFSSSYSAECFFFSYLSCCLSFLIC